VRAGAAASGGSEHCATAARPAVRDRNITRIVAYIDIFETTVRSGL
jgi:hypothetical protein